MKTLADALKKAGVVDPKKADDVLETERKNLARRERLDGQRAMDDFYARFTDEKEAEKRDRKAAAEARRPASNQGSKQYLNRFKK